VSKRKKKRGRRVVRLVALVSLTLAAALLWRWVWTVPAAPDSLRTAVPLPARTLTAPGAQPAPQHEEINAVERQALENILRQKHATGQR